jgi:hypothetical protein
MMNSQEKRVHVWVLAVIIFVIFLWALPLSHALTDENGENPRADETLDSSTSDKLLLQENVFSPLTFFRVYYNTLDTDPMEGVEANARTRAERAGGFLDCAWMVFFDPDLATPDLPFKNPMGSPHMFHPENIARIPVWVAGRSPSSGGSAAPSVVFSPLSGAIGCPQTARCDPPGSANCVEPHDAWIHDATRHYYGYNPVAFRELAHVLFKGYNRFFNSGPVRFLNEGLPSSLPIVPVNPFYDPLAGSYENYDQGGDDYKTHLNLSNDSLRRFKYNGKPFWQFLAMRYSNLPNTDGLYPTDVAVPDVCRDYLDAIYPSPPEPSPLRLRRFPGRDVVRHIMENFERCHPRGWIETPACRDASEQDILAVECATWDGDRVVDPGCIPQDDPGGWRSVWAKDGDPGTACDAVPSPDGCEADHRVGETLMPLVLDLIDRTLVEHHGMVSDGLPYQAFREFLVENYVNGPANEVFQPDPAANPQRYRVKAFGAHYHQLDLRNPAGEVEELVVHLEKDADLPTAAYRVFYREGTTLVSYKPWRVMDTEEIVIYPDHEQALLVVTAFEGTYDGTANPGDPGFVSYADSGGHYRMWTERITISADVFDDRNPATPPPGRMACGS